MYKAIKRLTLIYITLLVMTGSLSFVTSSPNTNAIETNAIKLSISTRHDAILYTKVAAAFVASPLAASVGITSTSEIKFTAPSTYEGFYRELTDPFFAKDIGWGGGPTLFSALAADNALNPITDPDVLAIVNNDIDNVTAGAEMKYYIDDALYWVGSAISSFGFTVNHQELESRGLPVPTTWEDLASPDYFTFGSEYNIGMGNAPDTTSNTRIYQIILQRYGWEKGWEILYRMAGNSKIYGGSTETLSSVITGETAVAMTIDFYGVNAMTENPNTEYIVPENGSIVNADPISLAVTPTHPAAANAFMKYVLSAEGQSVLFDDEINRLPVRADAFDTPAGLARPDLLILYQNTIANEGIIFDEDLATAQYSTMRWHFEFTITDVHTKLRNTWGSVISAYKSGGFPTAPDQRLEQISAVFGEPAISSQDAINLEKDITDAAFKLQKQSEWNAFSNNKLNYVNGIIDDDYTITSTHVITSGNTTFTSLITNEETNASSGKDTVKDVPVSSLWMMIGIITPVLVLRRKTTNLKKQLS